MSIDNVCRDNEYRVVHYPILDRKFLPVGNIEQLCYAHTSETVLFKTLYGRMNAEKFLFKHRIPYSLHPAKDFDLVVEKHSRQ